MAVQIRKSRATGALSLTPLIDVVFLLLIFFLVATRFEEEERSLAVALPQAAEAAPLTARPREIFVNIDDQGRYFVGRDRVSAQQLLRILRQAAANNPGRQRVGIRADRRCRWQPIVTVMDLCNKAGIRDYYVMTKEPEGS